MYLEEKKKCISSLETRSRYQRGESIKGNALQFFFLVIHKLGQSNMSKKNSRKVTRSTFEARRSIASIITASSRRNQFFSLCDASTCSLSRGYYFFLSFLPVTGQRKKVFSDSTRNFICILSYFSFFVLLLS
jgi:hypothetical protein